MSKGIVGNPTSFLKLERKKPVKAPLDGAYRNYLQQCYFINRKNKKKKLPLIEALPEHLWRAKKQIS